MIGAGAIREIVEEEVKEDCGFEFGWMGEEQYK